MSGYIYMAYVWALDTELWPCDICNEWRPARGSEITAYSVVICAKCGQLSEDEIERRWRAQCNDEAEREEKTFYRVSHEVTKQGLWYARDGRFTGLIHDELSFCANYALSMDFDPEVVGYVSVVETLEQLYHWFPVGDILRLQERGWFAYEYRSGDYKWYERFGHYLAKMDSIKEVRKITLQHDAQTQDARRA